MKLKASELIGKPLDFAVGLLDQKDWSKEDLLANMQRGDDGYIYSPSTIREQGYRILEEEGIDLTSIRNGKGQIIVWSASCDYTLTDENWDATVQFAKTALVAALRCFVVSRIGDEVDVPEELL
jgi:hypothetical protein